MLGEIQRKIKRGFDILLKLNIKTIFFNFFYFDFKTAIKFPVFISKNTKFTCLGGAIKINNRISSGMISIGYGPVEIVDAKYFRSIWNVKGNIIFNGLANFGKGIKIDVGKNGVLTFGNHVSITANSTIICFKEIKIGNECVISWDCLLMDTDFHTIYNANGNIINEDQSIIVGEGNLIGCRCLLIKGSIIGNGCVIGANTVIRKNFGNINNSILAGDPAIVLKENIAMGLKYLINIFKQKSLIRKFKKRNIILVDTDSISKKSVFEGLNNIAKKVNIYNSYIGKGTYIGYKTKLPYRKIGSFCSIADNVQLVFGSHPTSKFVSTHPAFFSPLKQAGFTFTTESIFKEFNFIDNDYLIEIGNDVWIGSNVLLMEGIKIGDGAIIGAGSVVTKNIEPYSINVGVPSKVVKYRFEKEEIDFLVNYKWWNKDFDFLKVNSSLFSDIKSFMKKFNTDNNE